MIIKALLVVFYFFLFHFLIYRFKFFRFRNFKQVIPHLLFTVKFITGIFIWFIYTYYYTDTQNNDVHKFYNDALVLRQSANESPRAFVQLMTGIPMGGATSQEIPKYTSKMKNWERNFDEAPFNENKFIIRLNALLLFISHHTYFVHILFMCFISFTGWVLITNSILHYTNERNAILALLVLFLPSALFWTSGIMKEPALILGVGLFIYGISDWGFRIGDFKISKVGCLISGIVIILFTKFFVLVCLLPASVAFLLFRNKTAPPFMILKYLTINTAILLLAFNIHYIMPRINPQQMLVNKQTHSIKEADYLQAGSRIQIPELTASALSTLEAAPVGVWNCIFRPYLWEGKNIMMLAAILENLFVLPFLLFCFAYTDWKNLKALNLFFFLLNFTVAYFALIGICTPVLGNLARYKAPVLPLFLFAFAILVNPQMIARNFDFLLSKDR